jgi:hypothetical protein
MFEAQLAEHGDAVGDAPPRRRPKQPFLKRGEGVNKRLNAYKLRDEAEALRKQRSTSATPPSTTTSRNRSHWAQHQQQQQQQHGGLSDQDDDTDSRPAAAAAAQQARRTWQQPAFLHDDADEYGSPSAALGVTPASTGIAGASASGASPWSGSQTPEVRLDSVRLHSGTACSASCCKHHERDALCVLVHMA